MNRLLNGEALSELNRPHLLANNPVEPTCTRNQRAHPEPAPRPDLGRSPRRWYFAPFALLAAVSDLRRVPRSFYSRGMDEPRRFPLPWTIGELPACFYVQDASGAKLAYVYFLDRDRLAHDADKLDRADALKIARNIAKLPGLLQATRGQPK